MKRLRIAAGALLCAAGIGAFGQGVRYDSRTTTVQTNMPVGANAPVLAIPSALVQICTTSDCTTNANIYQDQALTVTAPNPLTATTQGLWGLWAAAGTYWYKITTTQGIVYGPYAAIQHVPFIIRQSKPVATMESGSQSRSSGANKKPSPMQRGFASSVRSGPPSLSVC